MNGNHHGEGSADYCFFEDVKQWVKRAVVSSHRRRQVNGLSNCGAADDRSNPSAATSCRVWKAARWNTRSAATLQARLQRHHDEWLVFVDDPRVPPTNNLAEQKLRPLVVLRKNHLWSSYRSRCAA